MTTTIASLRSQVPAGVLAADGQPLRLAWRVESSDARLGQVAYEVQASVTAGFETVLATTGVVPETDQIALDAPGDPLRSREVRFFRVRISTTEGWTDWSPALRVEAGLLAPADWIAQAVTLPDDPGADQQSPSPFLRRDFTIDGDIVRARLHVTALGLHRVSLNGTAVSEDVLAPGWTTYSQRLLADTYDVTALLATGENCIGAVLGDGWFRGRIGWDADEDRCRYGREIGLIAQLEIELSDGTIQIVATDGEWQASTAEILSADLYDGSQIDLRQRKVGWDVPGFDARDWLPARIVPFDPAIIRPRVAPPVRRIASLSVERTSLPDGRVLLDSGQNIAGFVQLRVRGKTGDRVTIRHAEVLEPDGTPHVRSLRSARATDVYILADGLEAELEPAFTFHGFRYAEVATDAEIVDAQVIAISSDTPRRGWFESSDESLNRFHENVVWSQRDNFVSVPTDCPQRDERLGWTGDAQAFATTACVLFDSAAFWASWLRDLELDQSTELGVPSVVPDMVLQNEPRYGRAGWADAATIVPWAVYEAYGDPSILRNQFDSMRRWVESLRARRGPDGLIGRSMQFGDWLDPDAPAARPWEAKTSPEFLANAFFAESARLLADAAAVLGDHASETGYRTLSAEMAAATWSRWADHLVTTQTGCAVALQFRIVPATERVAVAAALARLVSDAGGRVATGFLGTPLVLPALAAAGHFDEAYLMLLRHAYPSWLYQVDQGATTVWERWDAIRPDGSIHPGTMTVPPDMPVDATRDAHMLSFNHYAYGAVVDWVYRHVAGIAPDTTLPGYRRVLLAPTPAIGIDWARASVDTPLGIASISWRMTNERDLFVDVELPFGSSGIFTAPVTTASAILVDGVAVANGHADGAEVALAAGRHKIMVSRARVAAGNPAAEES